MTSAQSSIERCSHEHAMAYLVDRYQAWRGYECPYCKIDSLQRSLDQRNEQIDGYERQLGIIDADATRTIGTEIARLLKQGETSVPLCVSDLLSECARRYAGDMGLGRPHPLWGAIEAYEAARCNSPDVCVCGEPNTPGVQHRTDGPCFVLETSEEQDPCVSHLAMKEYEREITALLDGLGSRAIRVREGGGPENLLASLAVTVAKLAQSPAETDGEPRACENCGTIGDGKRTCCPDPKYIPAKHLISKLWTLAYAEPREPVSTAKCDHNDYEVHCGSGPLDDGASWCKTCGAFTTGGAWRLPKNPSTVSVKATGESAVKSGDES